MDITNVKAVDLDFEAHYEIQVGKDWYLFAGNAYGESNMMIVNFFLVGIHHGLLGKVIVPKDFVFLTRPKQ